MLKLRCKVVMLGDACVGKTAISQMFHSGGTEYPKNYLMTSGTGFSLKDVSIPDENTRIEFYVHDVAGQKIYREQATHYMDGASVYMIVYDVTNRDSFHACLQWLNMCRSSSATCPVLLVGNKIDLGDRACIHSSEAESVAKENRLSFFEVSAAKGLNIDSLFGHIARQYLESFRRRVEAMEKLVF